MSDKIDEVKAFLKSQKYVKVAYLFGSHATGKVGPLSDVDIAVILDEKLTASERFDLRLKLITKISAILGITEPDKLDVVVMNDNPLLLNYNIIKSGKILVCKGENFRAKSEFKILSKYLDEEYYIRRHAERVIEDIAKRGLL